MKKLLFLSCVLFSISFYAQPPGGRGNMRDFGQRGQNNKEKPREFKARKAAGIFYYDVDKVVKKIKIKREILQSNIKEYLREYNDKVKNIALLNSEKFEQLNELMKNNRPSRNQNSYENNEDETDESVVNIRKKVGYVIRPVKKEIRTLELELNANMEAVLSEKQFAKWMKHQKLKKDKLNPKKQQNTSRGNRGSGGPPNGGGQRRMGI